MTEGCELWTWHWHGSMIKMVSYFINFIRKFDFWIHRTMLVLFYFIANHSFFVITIIYRRSLYENDNLAIILSKFFKFFPNESVYCINKSKWTWRLQYAIIIFVRRSIILVLQPYSSSSEMFRWKFICENLKSFLLMNY